MPDLLKISLHNVRFRAYHGVHPEEREKGNDFVVNMEVSFQPRTDTILSLQDTIDYATLFDIINSTMQRPVDLLETLVQTITYNTYKRFPQLKEVTVSVEKLNPPIDKFTGSAAVTFSKKY
ncbi:MAG: dihydroneopterin aldolase [Chitinophagaceae bacterium]|nr:dihydroneopterin aldolase [Chitinophagaceae bacterium]